MQCFLNVFFGNLQVIGVWERSFSLPDPITAQSLAAVEKRFVHAACTQIKYGPNSLSEYTKWRVGSLACILCLQLLTQILNS